MKSLLVFPFLLLGFLLVKGAVILEAANDNLSGIEIVKSWSSDRKDLSQIICPEGTKPIALVTKVNIALLRNAARSAYFTEDCDVSLAYWKLVNEINPFDETAVLMLFLSSGLDPAMHPEDVSDANMAKFLEGLGLQAKQKQSETLAKYWFLRAFELHPSRSIADHLVTIQTSVEEQAHIWGELSLGLPKEDPDHWWALGKQAEAMQQWGQASNAFQVGAGIAPEPYGFLMEQGSILIKQDRLDEAERVFMEAVSLRPDRSRPYLELGNVFRLRGDDQAARSWYERAVDIAPSNFSANFYLGLIYFRLANHKLAEQYLNRANEINPESSSAMYYLALAVYQSGRKEQARSILENAVQLGDEQNVNWLVKLGDWRYEANDKSGALEAYLQAFRLQPDLPGIDSKIQKVKNP